MYCKIKIENNKVVSADSGTIHKEMGSKGLKPDVDYKIVQDRVRRQICEDYPEGSSANIGSVQFMSTKAGVTALGEAGAVAFMNAGFKISTNNSARGELLPITVKGKTPKAATSNKSL